ncbi:MAG: cysteine synthase A [Clostridia bacterium]|nr:cysteine synthase A [Clostridia bacterium]
MKIFKSVSELVGKTPLMELSNIERELELTSRIFAKLEFLNPAGSVKDRVALEMIDDAKKKGLIKNGSVIIEPTSGNTGIGLACIAASRGYRAIIVMPDTMSKERIMLMKAYGAEVVLSDGSEGMAGAVAKAQQIADSIPNAFIAGQFSNPANPMAHTKSTGPEIYEDTDGKVDIFVAGVGTGGTISGVGEYLKSKNPQIKIVAVEPQDSPLLSKGKYGPHKLQGIGANFIPKCLNTGIYDEIITVGTDDAYNFARMASQKEGILVGISSGAALYASVQLAKRAENSKKNIVVLLPDTGERYLSTGLFDLEEK